MHIMRADEEKSASLEKCSLHIMQIQYANVRWKWSLNMLNDVYVQINCCNAVYFWKECLIVFFFWLCLLQGWVFCYSLFAPRRVLQKVGNIYNILTTLNKKINYYASFTYNW